MSETMSGSAERVRRAFAFERPDRTPLFEIFQPYHPIHWPICGRTVATDAALAWDAMSAGIAWEELVEATAQAEFQVNRFFGVDMVRLNGAPGRNYARPKKLGATRWELNGTPEHVRREVIECLRFGQSGPGGHILHASHSVHEDVKPQNYVAAVQAYREFFGLERLPW